jgi:ubiquinol-cytochrome c reductase iron-sulfur subunit
MSTSVSHHEHDGSGEVERYEGGGLPERFPNPGLPPHRHRMADIDEKAAKRAERQVATLFGLSALGTIITLVAYFAVKFEGNLTDNEYLRRVELSNILLGTGLFLALFCIGAGAVHWAKTLMPDEERIELRHPMRSPEEDREDAVAILKEGAAESAFGRRPLIRNSLIGALLLAPLPGVVFLRDTGPMPGDALSTTPWKKGTYLVRDAGGRKIKAADVQQGSIAHIMPEGLEQTGEHLNERAKAAVLLLRLEPDLLDERSRPGSYQGIVAYSKICTHMGCPVALYEQQTHHLLCPCHQSTFDVTQDCKVVFGPAKRPLPQLPITVDDEGYLVAKDGFSEPVGPSFWERG